MNSLWHRLQTEAEERETALTALGWIHIKRELPVFDQEVTVLMTQGQIRQVVRAKYSSGFKQPNCTGWEALSLAAMEHTVTHWRPEIHPRLSNIGPSDAPWSNSRSSHALEAQDSWRAMAYAPTDGTVIELLIRHQSWWSAKKCGEDLTHWEQSCSGYWIDFNGGDWTWTGLAGKPIGWRPLNTQVVA